MYSRVKIAGHPVHPMLITYPVAAYTGSLVGYAVNAADSHQFWLSLAIALSVVGAGSALVAALPGFADWAFGVPRASRARAVGAVHMLLNLGALGLFVAAAAIYFPHFDGPPADPTLGLALSSAGVFLTLGAGFLGWTLIQDYHVGVRLSPRQVDGEAEVQAHRVIDRRSIRRSA